MTPTRLFQKLSLKRSKQRPSQSILFGRDTVLSPPSYNLSTQNTMNETAHFRQESYELNKSSFSQPWDSWVIKIKSQYLEIERNPFESGIKRRIDRFINPDIRHI